MFDKDSILRGAVEAAAAETPFKVERRADGCWTVTDTRPTDLQPQWWKVCHHGKGYAVYSRRSRRQMPRDAVYYRLVVAAVQKFEEGSAQ